MRYFHAHADDEPQGPYELAELERLKAEGKLPDTTLVVQENGTVWQPLAAVLPPAKPPQPSETSDKSKPMPENWLGFYTYVRIPLGMLAVLCSLFASVFSFLAGKPSVVEASVALTIQTVITVFSLTLLTFLLIGLHKRRLWGWRLNWVMLAVEAIDRSCGHGGDRLDSFFTNLVAWTALWIVPNTVYFMKRRSLFLPANNKPKPITMLDQVEDVGGKLIVNGYRELAAKQGCAPTAQTSDQQIVDMYKKVGTAFHKASKQRGEHINAGNLNFIVWKFLQVKERLGDDMVDAHLDYEVQRYLKSGLRDDYQKDLQLF